ncbi:MAG: hypothetical protein ACK4WH_10090 [Phycisphaerales bacterium]
MNTSVVGVVSVVVGVLVLAGAAPPQPEQIVGDALRVEVSAGARSGLAVVPRSELVPTGEFSRWAWSSANPVEVFDGMGGVLGSFSADHLRHAV